MAFYVFHATPHRRARVHDGGCIHCREGKGQENQDKTGSGATGWSGPFATLSAAESFMRKLNFRDAQHCKTCLGS